MPTRSDQCRTSVGRNPEFLPRTVPAIQTNDGKVGGIPMKSTAEEIANPGELSSETNAASGWRLLPVKTTPNKNQMQRIFRPVRSKKRKRRNIFGHDGARHSKSGIKVPSGEAVHCAGDITWSLAVRHARPGPAGLRYTGGTTRVRNCGSGAWCNGREVTGGMV